MVGHPWHQMGPKEAGHSAKDMPCLEACSQRCLTVPGFTKKGEERDALTSASRVAEATIKRRSPRFFWIWKRRHQEIMVTMEQCAIPNQTWWLRPVNSSKQEVRAGGSQFKISLGWTARPYHKTKRRLISETRMLQTTGCWYHKLLWGRPLFLIWKCIKIF